MIEQTPKREQLHMFDLLECAYSLDNIEAYNSNGNNYTTVALAFSLKNSKSNNNTTTAAPESTTFILRNIFNGYEKISELNNDGPEKRCVISLFYQFLISKCFQMNLLGQTSLFFKVVQPLSNSCSISLILLPLISSEVFNEMIGELLAPAFELPTLDFDEFDATAFNGFLCKRFICSALSSNSSVYLETNIDPLYQYENSVKYNDQC
ncbi:hypothetical protein DICPUDRAFT_85571 [Dictyostelium purpureum]|uniref:Uncharacterized protein n=1 Tax=Dictyostelium purpureum TaxID=5786 RepID=F1A655_DICPU|nr:uncharacterized protein DICPUDRAFT_85571 [Dictyostelium purpureum]EGC28326.1 hypothetical protein DICPUDRAFT_85571 [Dictyostelium purpureum]|eukprot:XP_003295149.1 hypothetical protein DICPUDRAFT_85571 [Dictyostelium purpureum]